VDRDAGCAILDAGAWIMEENVLGTFNLRTRKHKTVEIVRFTNRIGIIIGCVPPFPEAVVYILQRYRKRAVSLMLTIP